MSQRTEAIETLAKYFEEKGSVLNAYEYSRETDTPIRFHVLKKMFGSWSQVERLMARREYRHDNGPETDVDAVLEARHESARQLENQWKEASENQDEKARREAEAQAVAEKLTANAATPEGANANKIAIGGPLPGEQPKFERLGATVNVHPETKERTVVDPQPELVDVGGAALETGKTPAELVAAAHENLNAGDVKVGDATDGGSQGSASTSTVAALGGTDSTVAAKKPAAKEADKK